ncbi:MAG TPA: efflux RND transporter periplasmic adaptor subunit [Blastocatellia bacterium]|nr:efflux RND transporter periplasmic adaptor subunit [Blastocatellia bacterium]
MFSSLKRSNETPKASRPDSRGNLLALGVSVVAALTFFSACKSGYPVAAREGPGGEAREPRKVKTARAVAMPMENTITVTGSLAAFDQATVSAKVPGRISLITVDLGSVVRKGQLIAQLEQQDYQLRLRQVEAGLAQARTRLGLPPDGSDDRVNIEDTGTVRQARALLEEAELKRDRGRALFDNGVISRAELDAVESAYKVALSRHQDALEEIRNRQALVVQRRSELEIARQQLTDTSVHAPFDGAIQEKRASLGEYLAAGTPLVTIVRTDPLRLRAEVPERAAHKVRSGLEVRVTVEGDSNTYSGRIVRLSPSIAAQNRILVVEAEVRNNGRLRPGSFARADIVAEDKAPAIAVPSAAIVSFAGIDKVISVQDGKAVEKPITLGRRAGEWTEVLSGITVGELVVVDPGNLQSGQPVTVVE